MVIRADLYVDSPGTREIMRGEIFSPGWERATWEDRGRQQKQPTLMPNDVSRPVPAVIVVNQGSGVPIQVLLPSAREEPLVVAPSPPPLVLSSPSTAVGGLGEEKVSITVTGSEGKVSILEQITSAGIDLAQQAIMARLQPQQFVGDLPIVQQAGQVWQTLTGGAEVSPTSAQGCVTIPKGYVLTANGRLVKTRRRRRRLATMSDIKDLSSLKGVLGTGKAFDLWIATHSR